MTSIPLRSVVAPPFQASKWVKYPLLIDGDEMEQLLTALKEFWIVQTSGLISIGQEIVPHPSFLEAYRQYITALQQGELTAFRPHPYFSSILTTSLDALYKVKINDNQCLVKVQSPVIQLQSHRFDYSHADQTFRSMALGYESIQWGIQFAYPHLYQDENLEIFSAKDLLRFPNTTLFKQLQQWIRAYTITTSFEVEGKRVNVPIRLGKQCLSWVNRHPQLQSKGLRVIV